MRGGALILSLILAQTHPVLAQQAAPPATTPKSGWQVDWNNERCVLTLQPGAANQIGFAVRLIPGATRPQLLVFVNTDTMKLNLTKPVKSTLELQPVAWKGEMTVTPQAVGKSALVLAFNDLDAGFLDEFAKAERLSFVANGETVNIPMKSAGKARQALQQCVDETYAELGLDPKPLATLRQPPQGEFRQLATMANYPPDALRARKSGLVVVRAIVAADGNVS